MALDEMTTSCTWCEHVYSIGIDDRFEILPSNAKQQLATMNSISKDDST
jgi:hypothetical protein